MLGWMLVLCQPMLSLFGPQLPRALTLTACAGIRDPAYLVPSSRNVMSRPNTAAALSSMLPYACRHKGAPPGQVLYPLGQLVALTQSVKTAGPACTSHPSGRSQEAATAARAKYLEQVGNRLLQGPSGHEGSLTCENGSIGSL